MRICFHLKKIYLAFKFYATYNFSVLACQKYPLKYVYCYRFIAIEIRK